jgi:triosephosphate isomerase (TIM)
LGAFEKPKNLIVAYEPVWAIGTGMTATTQDVTEAHDFIKAHLGHETPVLYGGSVKADNAKELSSINSVNGFLIGGASLKVDSLLAIYNNSIKD